MKRFLIIFLSVQILVISFCSKEPAGPDETEKTEVVFRSIPYTLSHDDVKEMLLKYDFYCQDVSWGSGGTDYGNLDGKGFNNDFELQRDSLVINDQNCGLMWQQSGSDYYLAYEEADEYITEMNQVKFAGYDDWRLPTLEEAMSLMEPDRGEYIYINPIFDREQGRIWTSDPYYVQHHWIVGFVDGRCGVDGLIRYHISVRAVRSVQSSG